MDTFSLYINPLATKIRLLVFEGTTLITKNELDTVNASSTFPGHIVEVVEKYNIKEVWCILGPGAFTLMRTVTLTVNTLAFSKDIKLKGCHIFDIIDTQKGIPLLQINPSEYICKIDESEKIFSPENLPLGKYIGFSSGKDFTDKKTFIEYEENPDEILLFFKRKKNEERLSPIYFKPPHITGSKKKVSHS